eukprot:snap_masked-scaffold_6-processed-gene-11.27-mRNA-1 protein AED:1.00 eAED:1.00 QI:0/-1/0/0/-1/1/1/0/261
MQLLDERNTLYSELYLEVQWWRYLAEEMTKQYLPGTKSIPLQRLSFWLAEAFLYLSLLFEKCADAETTESLEILLEEVRSLLLSCRKARESLCEKNLDICKLKTIDFVQENLLEEDTLSIQYEDEAINLAILCDRATPVLLDRCSDYYEAYQKRFFFLFRSDTLPAHNITNVIKGLSSRLKKVEELSEFYLVPKKHFSKEVEASTNFLRERTNLVQMRSAFSLGELMNDLVIQSRVNEVSMGNCLQVLEEHISRMNINVAY